MEKKDTVVTSIFGDKKQKFQESCYRELDKGAEFKQGW